MKPPKKSENLEVRLSHQDKTALQKKAAQEGRSVSAVVRELISDYLTQPIARSTPNRFMELIMKLKSKPKSMVAALVILVAPFTLFQFASAEDVAIELNGEYTKPIQVNGEIGMRSRTFATEIHLTDGERQEFELGGASDLSMSISVNQDGEQLLIDMIIREGDKLIAMPKLTTHFDAPIRVEVGEEGGELLTLNALPTKL